MARLTGFVFQDEYIERVAKLSDQELGRLVRALAIYHMTGETQELAGRESIAFDFIKVDIDRIDDSYNKKCEKLKENFTANGQQKDTKWTPNGKNKNPNGDKDKDKDKDIKELSSPNGEDIKKSVRFSPPTVDEVATYCEERKNHIDAQRFVDFYASKGWKVGSNPMKDWRAAVRTWEGRSTEYGVYELPL